ncbi:MAG: cytidyltransferase [Rhodospirillaceae bacterium]|nr:cytidyltransferase [Rhodospirillaceae bacterium]|tara:strand:+ start:2387 stop:2815 length:429 start_codon:yes stop_codon:yes gene_type:complete
MKLICVSGYFDPLHVGHLEYFERAKELGDELIVIVNSDRQAIMKKGKPFMPEEERLKIIQSLKVVDHVVLSVDEDRSVCETLRTMSPTPHMFCNAGDQTNNFIPERKICNELGISLVDGLGEKIQSSSILIENAQYIAKKNK